MKLGMSTQQSGAHIEDVLPDSVAFDRGVAPGAVILKVDAEPVASPADVLRLIDASKLTNHQFVLLLIEDVQAVHWDRPAAVAGTDEGPPDGCTVSRPTGGTEQC